MRQTLKGSMILLLFMALCFTACSPRILSTATTSTSMAETRDSVCNTYRERIVHDTVYMDVPREVERIVTRDTSSHLENSYARSYAIVKNGMLCHGLETKPQKIAVPVDIPVFDTLSLVEHYKSEAQSTSETQTIVTNELNRTQKGMITGFWILLAAVIATAAWKVAKLIR